MPLPFKLDKFFDLFGPLANTKPKRVALVLALAYITYYIFQKQYSEPLDDNNKKRSSLHDIKSKQNNFQELKEEKEKFIDEKEEKKDADSNVIKRISMSEEMLTITSCGYKPINGNYRWFLHDKKWFFFTDKSDEHFTLESNIGVNRVYDILTSKNISFEWDESIHMCWIISDIDGNIIYYAAPQINNEYIPNDNEWISIEGIEPIPQIFVNLIDKTDGPDPMEMFGNSIPNENEIKSVFRQLDVENTGEVNKEQVMEGFRILGYMIDNVSILAILPNENDVLDENEFVIQFTKHASAYDQKMQQNITFEVNEQDVNESDDEQILERKEDFDSDNNGNGGDVSGRDINGDNGVIVHEEVDNENNESNEDDDSISDLDS